MQVYTTYRGVTIYQKEESLIAYPVSGVRLQSKDIIILTRDINKHLDKKEEENGRKIQSS